MMPSTAKSLGLVLLALLASGPLPAQVRTLTDQFGRTLQAEVIAVHENTVTIKRDDGQFFDLPLKNLSDDDQTVLKAWAKNNPPSATATSTEVKAPAPAPGSVTMSLSRGKFDAEVSYQSAYYKGSDEEWGYNVQLTNTTLHPLDNLRVEYIIFGKRYAGSRQTSRSDRQMIPVLDGKKTHAFRTKAFRFNKFRSTDGSYNNAGGLVGVWARLYAGDILLAEYASPESLKTTEKWTTPAE